MKPVNVFVLLLSLFTLSVSCSSVKISTKKMLTGEWQNARFAKMDPGQENDEKPAGREDDGSGGPSSGGPVIKSLEFRSDKTATITYTDKTLNGSWKLNESDNIILFTEKPGGNTIQLHLARVNSEAMGLVETESGGEVITRYFRVK